MNSKVIKRILIANRGEIALRVMKTCKQMGIETVSIFREEEAQLPHRLHADISVSLGDGTLADTYLNIDKIIEIAKTHNVDAIHPGYGFLSENALFADALEKNKIIFIGPCSKNMLLMGDKKTSKQLMEKIGVPLVPGYHGDNQDDLFLRSETDKIGYPALIKASAGGGGKGMRVVNSSEEFLEALAAAKREAMNAFGDDKVLIEKYLTSSRHIEVQVMSDNHGQYFHFFERECSIQRRHQKIIEETPSIVISNEIRDQMCQQAVNICSSINYSGAGTIEFIFDDSTFYFLEMNTRLQVEHPVTEMITGFDLVELQILVAQGDKLKLKQSDIYQRGHSIEVRIYSEDPDNDFLPSIGTIENVGTVFQNNARLDSGYMDGNEVTINYDPMLAKLICWSHNRQSCIEKMSQALDEIAFCGVKTNRNYLKRLISLPEFFSGETYTDFVITHKEKLAAVKINDDIKALAIAASLFNKKMIMAKDDKNQPGVWESINDFRNL